MGDRDGGKRRRLEGVIPEIFKRAVEAGVNQATHAPENIKTFIGDLKLPKDIASYIFAQVDETKNGLFRVVAKEMRDFLEHTNLAGEMQKLLTTVQFEVNTTIRFRPNEPDEAGDAPQKLSKPEVKTEVTMSRRERREKRRKGRAGTTGAVGQVPPDAESAASLEDAREDEIGGGNPPPASPDGEKS
jgi:hypothetical protein